MKQGSGRERTLRNCTNISVNVGPMFCTAKKERTRGSHCGFQEVVRVISFPFLSFPFPVLEVMKRSPVSRSLDSGKDFPEKILHREEIADTWQSLRVSLSDFLSFPFPFLRGNEKVPSLRGIHANSFPKFSRESLS